MRGLPRRRIEEIIERGDYATLSRLCLELLNADSWPEGWERLEVLIQASGEYVLAKFMASAHVLASEEIYKTLSRDTRQFLARDVVVCLEKMAQVIDVLSQRGVDLGIPAARGV